MTYAIVSIGGKQYSVREGQRLLVDRIAADEGATVTLGTLLVGGDGDTRLAPEDVTVTARVVGHVLGEKIRIGKYKPKKGYRRHTGYRSRLSQLEIEAIGGGRQRPQKREAAAVEAKPEAADAAPIGYDGLKVGEVAKWAEGKDAATLAAALAHEQAHGARKGAIAALEAAIEKRKES